MVLNQNFGSLQCQCTSTTNSLFIKSAYKVRMKTDKVSFVTEVRYNNSHIFSNSKQTRTFHKHLFTKYIKEFVVIRYITQVFLVIRIFGVKVVSNSILQNLLVLLVKDAPIRWTCHNEIYAVAFQAWQGGPGISLDSCMITAGS